VSQTRRAADLLVSLGTADMRVRYGRGPWQFFKWLADPFAVTGVYLALVALVLNRPGGEPGLSVACAVVPFQLVLATVVTALDSTRARATIIGNMAFPRVFLPAAAAFTESLAFVATSVLLVLMMAVYQVAPTSAILWLPLVVFVNLALAGAISYPAALFALWLPDLRAFLISLMRTLFFLAPGLVPLSQIYGYTDDVLKINPLTGLFESYRAVLQYGQAPEWWMLAYPLAFAVILAAVFIPVYRREEPHLAKVLE
jgi:lipopolysaccharide transport system permease protein